MSKRYDKTVYGVGFLGVGEYKAYKRKGEPTEQYLTWKAMLNRCYNPKELIRRPTYAGSSVTEEWHNFQSFAKWYDKNYYTVDGDRMVLDKDIMVKGNKVYSPETCVFVPERLNTLLIHKRNRKRDLPTGISRDRGKFKAQLNIKGKYKNLGRFDNVEEAFRAYKEAKEDYIKEEAGEYKNKVPEKLYNALVEYEVEMDD